MNQQNVMRVIAALAGFCLLALVLVDAFETLVLPRRSSHNFRIARPYYHLTWAPFSALGRAIRSGEIREGFLSIYGPLSLLLLFMLWEAGMVVGFGLVQWSVGMQPGAYPGTLENDLYLSGASLFTLGTGDPKNSPSKLLAVIEGGLSLGFLGLLISYLPVLYQAFSKREGTIYLLGNRGGIRPRLERYWCPSAVSDRFSSGPQNSES